MTRPRDLIDIADAIPLKLPRGWTPLQTAQAFVAFVCVVYTGAAVIHTTISLVQWVAS